MALAGFLAKLQPSGKWELGGESVQLRGKLSMAELGEFAASFSASVKAHLQERFLDGELLRSFRIFDPASYRGLSKEECDIFGEGDLHKLLKHFCKRDQPHRLFTFERGELDAVKAEFRRLKGKLAFQAELGRVTWEQAWPGMLESAHLFPRVLMLAQVAAVLPMQTACVERGFSRHRIVKNRLSSRLKVATVDSLLRVGLLGPPPSEESVAFVKEAAELYCTKGHTGLVHKLLSVSGEQAMPYGEADAEAVLAGVDESAVAFPGSDEEASSEGGSESEGEDEEDGDGEVFVGDAAMAVESAGGDEAEYAALGF